ncbi:MAG: hypothetical protein NZL85_11355 [Fimbriimonadales bacterium]|nr:hypothetical protein [Fimbriimonadales bacterium]
MRGLKELLPLIIVVAIVAVLLLSWLQTGAQHLARKRAAMAAAPSAPVAGTFVAPGGPPGGAMAPVAVGLPPAPSTPDARLRQITTALLMYASDYDDKLPPMNDPIRLDFLLQPYVMRQNVFFDPVNKTRFGVNASLSLKSLSAISNHADTVVFFQQKPDKRTNKRWVAFLDGYVKAVDEKQWQRLSKSSGITRKPTTSKTRRKAKQN